MNRYLAVWAVLVCILFEGAYAGERQLLRPQTRLFALLPADVRHPEGITAIPDRREVVVGTFDAREPAAQRNNALLRYNADGELIARRSFGATPLTGIAYAADKIYILNFGASSLQRIAADFDADTPIEDLLPFRGLEPAAPPARTISNPDGSNDRIAFGASGFPAPNGMVFDRAGNLYVSDSFQGAIYRVPDATRCRPCTLETVSRDPLLATAGALPFGANGLALNAEETLLYINNAGDGRLLKMPLPAGPLTIVAESLHGADGLLFHDGLLWVAANQADVVVAVDESGRVQARAGEFTGIAADGSPLGLLFPATTAVLGDRMIVVNLSLPLTPAAGDEWEEAVTRWNLMQFELPGAGRPPR
jgi:hypothetical protein